MKLLKADVIACKCKGAGCLLCHNKGYFVIDRSYESTERALPPRKEKPEQLTYAPEKMQRIADGQCIYCGSPNLHTDRACEQCAQKNADYWQDRQASKRSPIG